MIAMKMFLTLVNDYLADNSERPIALRYVDGGFLVSYDLVDHIADIESAIEFDSNIITDKMTAAYLGEAVELMLAKIRIDAGNVLVGV